MIQTSIAVFLMVIGAFLFCMIIVLPLLGKLFPKSIGKWCCEEMGWHNGKGGDRSFDGCSVHAVCSICDKEVMQDSQGNWF